MGRITGVEVQGGEVEFDRRKVKIKTSGNEELISRLDAMLRCCVIFKYTAGKKVTHAVVTRGASKMVRTGF